MITRRTFLKRSAQAAIVAVAAPDILSVAGNSLHAEPLAQQALRIPTVISGGDLTIAPGAFNVYSDKTSDLLLINGSFPAPTIKIKRGDTFSATIRNNLTESTVLHWHGAHAPATMSGHPKSAVEAGASYSVNFPILQRSATTFYHAHPDMNTARQVYMGLAGLFLIEDDEELAMGLPSGEYDVPLMIQDKRIDANRQFVYDPTQMDLMSAWLGDTILVNGTPNPFLAVAPTLYRFRVVNGSNGRFYKLALSNGAAFTIIGNDGGFIEAPTSLTSANLAPGERLDILIDFSSYAQGQTITLKSLKFTFSDGPGSGNIPQGAEMNLLEFQVSKTGSSGGKIPTALPAIVKFNASDAKRTRVWDFAALHHINDQQYDIDRIDGHIPLGELEQWTFSSEAANTHPVHIHGAQFQVLDRMGSSPDPWEGGWKDVVRLDPLGEVNVLVKFEPYAGLFVIHCHKLEHADAGMMANFLVEDSSGVKDDSADDSTFDAYPNPATNHIRLRFPTLISDEALTMYDAKGTLVHSEMILHGLKDYRIDTRALAAGAYLLHLGHYGSTTVVIKDR